LPVLGVAAEGAALPAVVRCPLCRRQTLTVYKEVVRAGQWYHCNGCGFAGDGVELTAAVGDISFGTAMLKLAARGLAIPAELLEPEAIDRYEKKADFRRRVQAFWATARAATDDIGGTGPAQRRLGIAPGVMHSAEWRRRGGRFVGHCTANAAEALLRPGPLDYRLRMGKVGTGGVGWKPLFTGPGWRDLLVVAYHDMPGRVSGFLFIGREAQWPHDFVFAAACGTGKPYAIGAAMYEAALPPHPEFGPVVFVIEDPVLAVRAQVRHLVATDTPLPLVGSWGRPELRSVWASLPQRDLVHWAPEPDGRLIARARLSGGRVALAPAGPAVAGHLERSRPALAFQGMLAAARPWDAALEALLGRLAPAKAEELVLGLKLRPDETTGFLRACADDVRARLAALFGDAGRPRGVTISGKVIVESGGSWRIAKTGELICDAILRIDQVIRSAAGDVAYRGRIVYRGQTLPFWAPDHEIEPGTLRWIKTKVGQAGLGEVVLGTNYWSKHILAIAQLFEPPQSVRGLDVVGWDEGRNAFTLPQFILQGNGEVVTPEYVVPPEAVLPAAGLVPPERPTPGSRVALAWGDEPNELFWAAATCLLADILAPALGLPRTSTALVGPGAIAVGIATALAFGCVETKVPGEYRTILPIHARQMLDAHRWPLLVRRSADDAIQVVNYHALGQFGGGVVAAAGAWAGETLALADGWHVITGPRPATADRAAEHGGTILRAYLKDLCDRRLALDVSGTLIDAISADLDAWYSQFAASRAVAGSRAYITADDPDDHPNRFGRLVCHLIDCGELHFAPPGTNATQVITVLDEGRVHIPKWSMGDSLARKHAVALNTDALSLRLRAAGILVEERNQDYFAGWVVPERWLRQHMGGRRHDDGVDVSVTT
jgi:hypothetical protein